MANTGMQIMHAAKEQTSCYYLGAFHLQASFLSHKSSLPLYWYTGNQNTHFTVLYNLSNFHTSPETQTLIVSHRVQSSSTVTVGVWSYRISTCGVWGRDEVRRCRWSQTRGAPRDEAAGLGAFAGWQWHLHCHSNTETCFLPPVDTLIQENW